MEYYAIRRRLQKDYYNGEYKYPGLTKDSHYRFQPCFNEKPKLFETLEEAEHKLGTLDVLFECEIVKFKLVEVEK